MSTATATVLFTDVEGSTARRTQLGEEAADRLFRELERSLRSIVTRRRGRVLKTAGDGIMAAFESASEAVAAAVEIQQAVAKRDDELGIRVGIAAGDVSWEGDDCFGIPVVTAARLEAAAASGQIVVSQVVRWLAGDRAGAGFEPIGPLELKGLPDPVEAFTVQWAPAVEGERSSLPLPPALALPADLAFVGRAAEWDALEQQWCRVADGGRAMVLLGGEAGAGKTRLATEFARRCHADGAIVLFGGCDADLVVPYQPWVEVLDHLLRSLPPDELDPDVLGDLGGLASLLPQLDRSQRLERPPTVDPDSERYRLFGAVDAVLAEAGRRWPVVILLDDLHWGGSQTLALLARLARAGTGGRTLIVGTFRDTGDEITEPLAATLADLRRVDGVVRLRVGELGEDDVASLIGDAVGQELGSSLRAVVSSVAERSRGNAFFVGELWRHLVSSGVVTQRSGEWVVEGTLERVGVPESIREVVAGRLARLDFPTRRLAELVAIAGQRIDLQVLRMAADLPAAELSASLDELVRADLIEAVDRPRLTYRFTHALVRDTVDVGIPPAARVGLHLRIADALEMYHEADRRPVLAELAGHYAAAVSLGTTGKATYYLRQAAEQAYQSVAYDEAAGFLETLLAVVEPLSAARADALIALGRTEQRRTRFEPAMQVFEEAFDLASQLGEVHLAVEGALGFEDALHTPGHPGEPAVVIVRRAIELLDEEAGPLRARLEASLARGLCHAGRLAEAEATLESALRLARESGDEDAVGAALEAALILSTDPHKLLEFSAELERVASDDPWRLTYSTVNQARAHLMLGDFDLARIAIRRHHDFGRSARFLMVEVQAMAFGISLALAEGAFREAEESAEQCLSLGSETIASYAEGMYGLQMFVIRRAQGRLSEVRPILEVIAARPKETGAVWRPGLAVLYAELGMLDEARRELDLLAPDGFAAIPRDAVWPGCASFVADVCIALGAVERAETLYDECRWLSGQAVMTGMTVCLGPADRWLGGLASVLGRSADATAHFESALALAARSGAPVWRADCQFEYARALAAAGDTKGAVELASDALFTARELGMAALVGRCEQLLDSSRHATVTPTAVFPNGLSAREIDVLRLVAAGCSNREIGERLLISGNTAANHVRAILQKTCCTNRAEAATYAARNGLLLD